MKNRFFVFLFTILLYTTHFAKAQDDNGSLIERFFAGRQQFQNSFSSFLDSINIKFAEYLSTSWEQFNIESPIVRPRKPNPKEMPVYTPDDSTILEKSVIAEQVLIDSAIIEPIVKKGDMEVMTNVEIENVEKKNFFGNNIQFSMLKEYDTNLTGIDESKVADYWRQLSKTNYSVFIEDLVKKKTALGLNSWGFYQLILEWTNNQFDKKKENEKAVFIVFMLNQAGYKAKIGRIGNSLVVMMAFRNSLYGKPYIKLNNDNYYLLSDITVKGLPISSYRLNIELSKFNIDLNMTTIPKFAENVKEIKRVFKNKTYTFKINSNLIDYYNTFPLADLTIFADAPLSGIAVKNIENELSKDLQNKNVTEKLNFLLSLIQNGFDYMLDEEQFGREKFLFAEETLFYPFSDCEDRAILFCRLVKLILGLDTLLIDYPTHVASAVKLNEPGDAIIHNNERYIICDPSYFGAPIAKKMQGQDNSKAKIILVN